MEIAARDAAIAGAMIVGAKDPTEEEYVLCKIKNNLWTERSQMDYQRSVLMAELKGPCASACDTTLSQSESPSPCGAFKH